jgi:hypothetical protein
MTAAHDSSADDLPGWIAPFIPQFDFHPNELYFPRAMSDLLAPGTTLVNTQTGVVLSSDVTEQTLADCQLGKDEVHLVLTDAVIEDHSFHPDAPLYVVVQTPPDDKTHSDATFFMLLAFNGSQAARVKPPGSSFDALLPDYGKHQGDIECVTVRLDITQDPIAPVWVRFEAHGTSSYVPWADVAKSADGRPIVRVGLGSHATYNVRPGQNFEVSDAFEWEGMGFDLGDAVPDGEPTVQTWSPVMANLRSVAHELDGTPAAGAESWTGFKGRIGLVNVTNKYNEAPTGLGYVALDTGETALVDMIQGIALAAGKIPPEATESDGPVGFGSRDAACVAPTASPFSPPPPSTLGAV